MPFAKRAVSPVDVSQHRLPPNVRQNELDCIANGTLANLIRQLSSLSRHAEDIFGELYREAVKVEHKTNTLFNRIDRLAVKVTQLDSKVEEVSLQDIHLRKPFKSSSVIDQQSLSRHTMPIAMAECYSRCDRPPDLDKLNQFRDDGKPGLKFYTDPDYFFALWREEMLKDADNVKKVHKTKNSNEKRRKPRHSHENRQKYYDRSIPPEQPVEPTPTQASMIYQTSHHPQMAQGGHYVANGRLQTQAQYFQQQQTAVMRPESLELQYGTSGYGSMESAASSQPHLRQQQQRQSVPMQEYAVINRKQQPGGAHFAAQNQQQQRPNGSTGTTPSVRDFDQTSPRSLESSESGQSRYYGQARPSQPPPAPPPPPPQMNAVNIRSVQQTEDYNRPMANGDLPNRFNDMNLGRRMQPNTRDASPPPPPPPTFNNFDADRSTSPDLPPPPPPLIKTDSERSPPPLVPPVSSSPSATRIGNGTSNTQAPPAPPPPPPPPIPAKITEEQPSPPSAGSTVKSGQAGDTRTLDARSDLLKAIRQGIQLKKVDRQEEKARDDAAVEKGNDVAAILKRRMEDVMGRSESEDSASDFENDWDDD